MLFSDSSSSLKYLHIFLAAAVIVLVVSAPPCTHGNPITKRQFLKVLKLLEESLTKEIPSDDVDKYSDVLFQEKYDKKNLTYYHAGNKKYPVFISNGLGNLGGNVHVLVRGEDYINPKDRNNFVVLRKFATMAGGYTLHQAHIVNMDDTLKKGAKILWNDGWVEQQKNVKDLLEQMGNAEVQARSTRAQRPQCDWLGYTLFCNTPENVPPARERQSRPPLDEEDVGPQLQVNDQPPGQPPVPVGEQGPLGTKLKRYTDLELIAVKKTEKENSGGQIENELIELKVVPQMPLVTSTTTMKVPTTKRKSRLIIRTTSPTTTTSAKPLQRSQMIHTKTRGQLESGEASFQLEELSIPPTTQPIIVEIGRRSGSEEAPSPWNDFLVPSSNPSEIPTAIQTETKSQDTTVPKKPVVKKDSDKERKEDKGKKTDNTGKDVERLSKKKHKKKHHKLKRKIGGSDEDI